MENQWDPQSNFCEDLFTWPSRKDIEIPNVMAVVGNLKGRAVLDFGCGPGNYTRLLRMNGAERVVGYDISESMIKRASEREAKEGLGIVYTSNLSPNLNGQFDLVLIAYVMQYAFTREELHDMCSKMARVIRPGGRLIAVIINPDYDITPDYYDAFGVRYITNTHHVDGQEMIAELCLPPHFHQFKVCYWSQASMETAFREAGFSEINWRKLTIYGPGPVQDAPGCVRNFFAKPRFAILECFLPK